jgi:hypothetical protein
VMKTSCCVNERQEIGSGNGFSGPSREHSALVGRPADALPSPTEPRRRRR